MRKVAPSRWHWLNRLGGLLTACLLLLSAAQAAETVPFTWSQTYLSTDTPSVPAGSDLNQIGGHRYSPALVGTQPVFAFGASLLSADCPAPRFHVFRVPPVRPQPQARGYLVCFRQRLLDHQIAINAP